jgi:hypothetical protein
MSNLMKLFGTLMAVLGLVLGVVVLAKPGYLDAMGIRLDTAVLLLVGGVLSLGLGGVIDVMRQQARRPGAETVAAVVTEKIETVSAAPEASKLNFGRKPAEAAAVVAATTAVAAVAQDLAKPEADAKKADPVAETISALEQAKADVIKSMGGMDSLGASSAPAAAAEPVAATGDEAEADEADSAEAADGDDDLFVVEEKVIRGRPARILSDDTVEAETDEGWMRFENLEHLNEYLDSVEEQAS